MAKVHVILACYNGLEYIDEQLQSVLRQADVGVHLHAYDDCSTDGTFEFLQGMAARDNRVSVYRASESSGSAFANFRRAILSFSEDLAAGDLVAFCDQDDVWEPEKLKKQIAAMRRDSAVGSSTSVNAFYANGRTLYINNAGKQTPFDFLFEGGGQGCTYLFEPLALHLLKASLKLSVDRSLQAVPHDWLLYALCRVRGWTWIILEEPLVRYRQHESNAFGARSSLKGKMARLRRLRSGHFAQERARLCELLILSGKEEVATIPFALVHTANIGERFATGAVHLASFRRSLISSIVVAIAYILGMA